MGLLAISLAACGGKDPLTKKREELQEKKSELLAINEEIKTLEEDIIELDPSSVAEVRKAAVAVNALKPTTFQHFVKVQGKVEARKNIVVSPKATGTLTQIYVSQGQRVGAGKVLAQIDNAMVRSNLAEVQTQLDLAQIMYDKQQRLWDQKIGTEVQYLTAKNQKESLERRLETLQEQLDMYQIKAPISGVVDEVMPKLGEAVSPGMPAFRIVNTSDLRLTANLSESYIPYVKKGDEVKLYFPALRDSTKARVSYVGQSIEPNNRTFEVEVDLPNSANYKPNMFGEISINDRTVTEAIVISLSLIQRSEQGSYVFVVEKNEANEWIAQRRNIKPGLSYNGIVEVESGLQAGERVVSMGFKGLSDGQMVTLEEEPNLAKK